MTWTPPPVWSVPRIWSGRAFVICGGESVNAAREWIPYLQGHVIAVKEAALLRPDADVLFLSGENCWENCKDVIKGFRGGEIVARGRSDARFPARTRRIGRTEDKGRLSDDPTKVCGRDGGTSAINLAYLLGADEIVLIGYDMRGGRWLNGERKHTQPKPPKEHFARHLECLPTIAADLRERGVSVINTSKSSAVTVFPYEPLETFL